MDKALLLIVNKALKDAGLKEDYAKFINVEKEEDIGAKINELKETLELKPEDLIAKITEAGLGAAFENYFQAETDRRITKAIETHDKKLKDKKETPTEPEKKPEKKPENMTPEQENVYNLTQQIKSLTDSVTVLMKGQKDTAIQTDIKAALKKAELPETFIKFVKTDNPDKVAEEVETLKSEVLDFQQTKIDEALKKGENPARGAGASTLIESQVTEFAEQKNKGASSETFEGKEIPGITTKE